MNLLTDVLQNYLPMLFIMLLLKSTLSLNNISAHTILLLLGGNHEHEPVDFAKAVDLSGKIKHFYYHTIEARGRSLSIPKEEHNKKFSHLIVDKNERKHFELLNSMADLPYPNSGSFGGLINGLPIICGGTFFGDVCLTFSPYGNSWSLLGYLPEARMLATATVIKHDYLFIIGGYTEEGVTNSTLAIHNGKIKYPTYLPFKVMSHCAVAVNNTHIFVAGGIDENDQILKSAWMLNVENGETVQLPMMIHPRACHVCGLIRKSDGHKQREAIVVAGGIGQPNGDLLQTDVFVLHSQIWIPGPEMPVGANGASGVTINDTLIVAGGKGSTSITELNVDRWQWIERKERLQKEMSLAVGLSTPKALFEHIKEEPKPRKLSTKLPIYSKISIPWIKC